MPYMCVHFLYSDTLLTL